MRQNLLLLLSVVICTGVALVPGRVRIASADNTIDCSGLKKVDFDHKYKKGDRIWTSYGYTGSGYARKCILDECYEKSSDDNTAWKTEGECSSRPAGV
ncbi:MAG TPA: hypothetical protein VGL61_21290 [Kofleriaceae bacterium]|jgi:hypothetical protein